MQKRGITTFRSKFFVSQYRKISLGNTSVYQKILGSEKFYASERGGGIKFLRRKLFVTQYQKISFGNTSVFQKISCIAKCGGGASGFCRNFLFHRTETKSFVKEPFCFPEIFWCRKKFMDKRGLITIFSRNSYVSQCRKLS